MEESGLPVKQGFRKRNRYLPAQCGDMCPTCRSPGAVASKDWFKPLTGSLPGGASHGCPRSIEADMDILIATELAGRSKG